MTKSLGKQGLSLTRMLKLKNRQKMVTTMCVIIWSEPNMFQSRLLISILCAYLQSFNLHCFEDHYGKQRFSNFFQNYFLPMQVQKEIIHLKALISDYMVCTYLGKVRGIIRNLPRLFFFAKMNTF